MKYARCFSTLGCPNASLEEAAAIVHRHGLAGIEIRALGGTVDLPDYFARQFRNPGTLATHVRGCGLGIVALDTSLRLVGNTAAEREQLLALAPWAEALGVSQLRVFDGGRAADESGIAEARATFRWWQQQRQTHGWRVDLMVETHDSLFTVAALQRFLAAVPEARLLWDSHHTWKRGAEAPDVTWRALRPHICHVHVKDSISRPSDRHPFTYVLPGRGEFPMGTLRRALQDDHYAGPVSLEWEKLWHPYLPEIDDALDAAAGWW
jgi:sugar phosphate isomerase/epimerase